MEGEVGHVKFIDTEVKPIMTTFVDDSLNHIIQLNDEDSDHYPLFWQISPFVFPLNGNAMQTYLGLTKFDFSYNFGLRSENELNESIVFPCHEMRLSRLHPKLKMKIERKYLPKGSETKTKVEKINEWPNNEREKTKRNATCISKTTDHSIPVVSLLSLSDSSDDDQDCATVRCCFASNECKTEKSTSSVTVKHSLNDSRNLSKIEASQNSTKPNDFSVSFYPNTLPPPQRPWIHINSPERNRQTHVFTILCYNILCDKYATRQMYGYCPSWALNWDYRKKTILEELKSFSSDIVCLQEVETEQFHNFYFPELKKIGYSGIFSPKSRAKTMSENERKHVDGCAIFYRTDKFSLIKEHLVEFNQLAMANAEGSDHMLNRVMTKDNIGLAALFQVRPWSAIEETQSRSLLVCTCHIHWDPEFCDVKLIQSMMLMRELKRIAEDISLSSSGMYWRADSLPLILCGDFNSLPRSGAVQFLSMGKISSDHPDFKELPYRASLRKLCPVSEKGEEFTHPFQLISAYNEDVMPFTNYTFDFKGMIDYIYYTKANIRLLGLLGPLDAQWLKENKVVGCPHPHVPSDHFPLLVEMELLPFFPSNGLLVRR